MKKKVSIFIAYRYFFVKKKRKFINILTLLAILGVAFGTFTLVIAPAVINGLGVKLRAIYEAFDPDIKIHAKKGLFFKSTDIPIEKIRDLEGVNVVSLSLEDYALLVYDDKQIVANVRGIDTNFIHVTNLLQSISNEKGLHEEVNGHSFLVVSDYIAYLSGLNLEKFNNYFKIHYPKKIRAKTLNTKKLYNTIIIKPTNIFNTKNMDSQNTIFLPLDKVQSLIGLKNTISSINVSVKNGVDNVELKKEIGALIGSDFSVRNKDEQHKGLIRALELEKIVLFIVFTLILCVSSINILFSLTLLVIEKKADIKILNTIGMPAASIGRIYIYLGFLIAGVGTFLGLCLGLLLILVQSKFGIITMGQLNEPYPVLVEIKDLIIALGAVVIITLLSSLRPATLTKSIIK